MIVSNFADCYSFAIMNFTFGVKLSILQFLKIITQIQMTSACNNSSDHHEK